ncbi:hypothetical protein V8G54_030788, partial [Vigna mungo]
MLGSGSRRVGGGEERVAEGALELDRVAEESGLEMGPVPRAFAFDGARAHCEKALVALPNRPDGSVGVRVGGGGRHCGSDGGSHWCLAGVGAVLYQELHVVARCLRNCVNENEQELDRLGLVYIELVFGEFDALHGNGEKRKKNGAWVHAT